MPKRLGGPLASVVRTAISVVLLGLILQRVGWQGTWQALRAAHRGYLAAALVLALLGIVVRAYRWGILVRASGMHISFARLTHLYFVGTFFSTFLPTGIGGDVVRIYEVAQGGESPAAAVGTVLLDRATGLLVLFGMASLALLFSHELVGAQTAVAILLVTAGSWGAAALVMQRGKLDSSGLLGRLKAVRPLRDVYDAVVATGSQAILLALAVSLLYNVLLIAMNYAIAVALGVRLSLWYFLLFVPLVSLLLMLPISVSGLGVREGGYMYWFAQAGVTAAQALSMSLTVYALNVVSGLIGGVLYTLQGVRELRTGEPG